MLDQSPSFDDSRSREADRERAELLRLAMGVAKFGVWSWDIDEDRIRISDGVGPMLGLNPGQGPRQLGAFLDAVAPEARAMLLEQIARLRETGVPRNTEFPFTRSDGSTRWARLHTTVLRDASGRVSRAAGIALDITEQRNAVHAKNGALRALRTLSAANEELVRASSEQAFLEAVCKVVVEKGGYLMAWVGFADDGPDKPVRPVSQYGNELGYLATAGITWADTMQGRGPTGSAIRTGESHVVQDVLTSPAMAPWREAALARGFRSCVGLPLKDGGECFGALSIYARESDAFGDDEVALLVNLAADLAFGIVTLRIKEERDRIAEENRQYESRLRQGLEQTIQAISTALELHDEYTSGHQERVAALAVAIARELALPEHTITGIKVAAIMHDLGKIKVPAECLAKPGKLSESEFRLIQGHAEAGRDILKDITFPWPVADVVWQHHERLDGSGYPRALRGDAILLEARVIAVADVVEAMATRRPYRPAVGMDAAIEEITRGRGVTYDATVVDACVRLYRDNRFAFPV